MCQLVSKALSEYPLQLISRYKGIQWVAANATVVVAYEHEGTPCIQTSI